MEPGPDANLDRPALVSLLRRQRADRAAVAPPTFAGFQRGKDCRADPFCRSALDTATAHLLSTTAERGHRPAQSRRRSRDADMPSSAWASSAPAN